MANKNAKGHITCVDCKTEGLKAWQVSPAIDLAGAQYRCGPCSVKWNAARTLRKATMSDYVATPEDIQRAAAR